MRDPGHRALHQAVRAALVATTAFFIGRFALDSDQFAVVAGFSAFALSAFADFGGPPRARVSAYLAAGLTGVPLVAAGTALSESAWASAVVMLGVGFAASFASLYGGYLAAGLNTILLLYVVAAGVPAPASAIGPRLGGLATGTALAAIGSVALWPKRPRRDFRGPLAAALRALSAWLGSVASGQRAGTGRVEAEAAVAALRPELSRMVDRPSGPRATDRAQLYLIYNLDRVRDLIARLAGAGGDRPGPFAPGTAGLLADARATLDSAAGVMAGGEEAVPASRAIARVRAAMRRPPPAVGLLDPAHADPAAFVRACDRDFAAQELAATAAISATHARAASGRGGDADLAGGPATLRPEVRPAGGFVREAWLKARADLTLGSPRFRSSLRLAVGLAAALGVVKAFDLRHGFWVALATLVVMRTSARQTSITALRAALGVLIGFAVSLAVVLVAESDHWVYALLLPIAFFASVWAAEVVGLIAGQACFTVLVVCLFNVLKPSGWTLGAVRVEDVLIGAAVGLLVGLAIWPRGAAGQLRSALAGSLQAGAGYAAATARRHLGVGGGAPPDREAAALAARRAEDAFAGFLAERRPTADQLASWSETLVAADRLWYTADRAALRPVVAPVAGPCAALLEELEGSVSRLEAGYRALAGALAEDRAPPAPPAPAPALDAAALECARSGGAREGGPAAGLLWVRYWMADLGGGLRRLARASGGRC